MCRSSRSSTLDTVFENSNSPDSGSPPVVPEEREFAVGALRLRGRSWGPGPPDAILLHGLASNARIWDGVASELAALGISTLALDLRGHGRSDQPTTGYDFDTLSGDIDAVFEESEASEPIVVGHSWGAHVALHHAVHGAYRATGLVLVDGGYLDYRVVPGLGLVDAETKLAPSKWAMPLESWLESAWLGTHVSGIGGWVRGFLEAGVVVEADGLARPRLPYEIHLAIAHELVNQEPRHLFAELSVPFRLCVAVKEDLPFPKAPAVELVRSAAPMGIYCNHDGVSHDIPLFEPSRLAGEIADFHRTNAPSRAR
ncbi:MAG: alpha/beta fold hydrolase [Acidimicrobiales bacterium]